jgi:hypothetical protein
VANVAGIMDWFLPVHEVDDETWRRVLAVNLDGPNAAVPQGAARDDAASRGCDRQCRLGRRVGGRRGGGGLHAVQAHPDQPDAVDRVRLPGPRDRLQHGLPGRVGSNIGHQGGTRSQWGHERLGKVLALAKCTAQPTRSPRRCRGCARPRPPTPASRSSPPTAAGALVERPSRRLTCDDGDRRLSRLRLTVSL